MEVSAVSLDLLRLSRVSWIAADKNEPGTRTGELAGCLQVRSAAGAVDEHDSAFHTPKTGYALQL